ncbi:ChaN family lipoprotein [Notoacmeibacter sp. MSK16QG-6]|uniref:ChaN family lipoprotein n=1 Tax=Notoacmeibacter sp. MSK16QG-6 TaxID=2957982 RepID=UPI0020A0AA20|nr:ChaN family lipoprotein [Notoacmeibacter sp. MSK16QG-6]MCP1200311.1 ChaN family lipoprotein [Notoacmeibacter sp. MSK16QG-6]
MRKRLFGLLLGLATLLSFFASATAAEQDRQASDTGQLVTPLGDVLGFDALLDQAASKSFVLVGEIHTAASHHVFQARLIEGLVARDRRPVVILEMLSPAAQPVLDRWIGGEVEPADLDMALKWAERGWPDFEIYRPIFEAARRHGLTMRGAGLERSEIMAIGRSGEDTIDPARRQQLMLDRKLTGPGLETLQATIVESHCGMVDKASAGPMILIQRARDGAMAREMIRAGSSGAVLIAGDGHVRRDHGVPRLLPAGSSYVIGQFETEESPSAEREIFDAFHLTEPVDRGDPCEDIRSRIEGDSDATEDGDAG